jgi:alpha-N-arabinofuranosidase
LHEESDWIIATATVLLAATVKLGAAQQNAGNAAQQLKVEIDTQQNAQPVSRYEYGMFIEHIGALIYRSLWSQPRGRPRIGPPRRN